MNSGNTEKVNKVELILLLLEGSLFRTTACNILFLALRFLTHVPVKM